MGGAAIKAWKTRKYIAKPARPVRAHKARRLTASRGRRCGARKKEGTRLAPDA